MLLLLDILIYLEFLTLKCTNFVCTVMICLDLPVCSPLFSFFSDLLSGSISFLPDVYWLHDFFMNVNSCNSYYRRCFCLISCSRTSVLSSLLLHIEDDVPLSVSLQVLKESVVNLPA